MTDRERLPERRYSETLKFTHDTYVGPHKYIITVGFYEDGRPGEIFMNTEMKAGSLADATVADAAVAASLALQYGCPLDVLRAAMKRAPSGEPMGPLAHALDAVSVRFLEMRATIVTEEKIDD
jgi:hypothetical protein